MSQNVSPVISARVISPNDPKYAEVLEFLFEEAALLDHARFDEWLGLLTEDIRYVMPIRVNTLKGDAESASKTTDIFSENLASLQLRVRRLGTGYAWSETPPSRTRHFVSNLRVTASESANEASVTSYLLVYRSRGSEPTPDIFSGERQDVIRWTEQGLRLAQRTILLDQAVIGARHLSIFF